MSSNLLLLNASIIGKSDKLVFSCWDFMILSYNSSNSFPSILLNGNHPRRILKLIGFELDDLL